MINNIKHIIKVVHSVVREKLVKPHTRSSEWPKVRKSFLSQHNTCAACGSTSFLQVHHIISFKHNASLELDPKNFITLCMSKNECHLLLGHSLKGFKWYNPQVRTDVLAVKSGEISLEEAKIRAKNNAVLS